MLHHRAVLRAQGLVKRYGSHTVVDEVTFELEPGTVTAFLGPNGAGKSTTLRMITGLTPPTAGGSWLAGRPFQDWPNPARLAGVLLDASATHPARTGGAHLLGAALLVGMSPARVDQVLDQVGLSSAADQKIGTYSLGMRQRLGLAQALLTNPPMLILDEPINGLDPIGIRDIRELLRGYAAEGGTVLLSSHVLSEVSQTADRVLMIDRGRIVADGPLTELLATQRCLARGPDMTALGRILARAGIAASKGPDRHLLVEASVEQVSDIAFHSRVQVYSLVEQHQDLEELFLTLSQSGRR